MRRREKKAHRAKKVQARVNNGSPKPYSADTLNARQERFCYAYAREDNGTQAAIKAGYAESGAHGTACRLLKLKKIQDGIAKFKHELGLKIHVKPTDADRELTDMMFHPIDPENPRQCQVKLNAIRLYYQRFGLLNETLTIKDGRETDLDLIDKLDLPLEVKKQVLTALREYQERAAGKVRNP